MTDHDSAPPSPARVSDRFLALFVDMMLLGLIGMILFLWIFLEFFDVGQGDISSNRIFHAADTAIIHLEPSLQGSVVTAEIVLFLAVKWAFLILLPAYILYSAGYEASPRQATSGKTAMHLVVRDNEGRPIGIFRSLLRTAVKIACMLPFGIGMLPVLFSMDGRGIHDRVSGTVVITGNPSSENPAALALPDKIFGGIIYAMLVIMWYLVWTYPYF